MIITLSGNLRRFADFETEIEVEAESVDTAVGILIDRYPGLRVVLYDAELNLRNVHRLYHNGEILSADEVSQVRLKPDDEIGILTALAGG